MERTTEDINRQIEGLTKMKTWLPEYSGLRTPNWRKIDAQIEMLKGGDLSDFDEGDWDEMDEDNEVYRAAEDAENWLQCVSDDDLFEER